jgi:hypothetical protein
MSKCECEKCVHFGICEKQHTLEHYGETITDCKRFKDKSLFVELPVNLGTILYQPIGFLHSVYEYKVSSLTQKADGSWKIRLTHNSSVFEIRADEIGKRVFLTEEEAERKLREVGK